MKKEENGIAGPLVGTTQEIAKTPQEVEKPKSNRELVKESIQSDLHAQLLKYNKLLNNAPDPTWIKENKYSDNAKYLPIRTVESLLRSFFGAYQIEMIGQPHLIGNSVVVSVHLKIYHPILREWLSYAGTGAVPIELESTKKTKDGVLIKEGARHALDFEKLNSKALHKNIPAAKSFAVSNAAKSIGRVFGSDLNNDEMSQIFNVYGL